MTMEKVSDDSVANDGDLFDMVEGVMRADSDEDETPTGLGSGGAPQDNFGFGGHLSLKQQARQLVLNVREYFAKERENQGPLMSYQNVLERTCCALKLTPTVVQRICRPQAWCNRPDTNSRLHPLRIDAIKNFIEMYYRTDPTASVTKAYEKIVRSGLFSGSHTTLRRMLQKEGFEFVRGKRRCDTFQRVRPKFIFEDFVTNNKSNDAKDVEMKDAPKPAEEDIPNLEPLDSLQCEQVDLEFFRSILPAVAKLNDQEKLNFRVAVMNKMLSLTSPAPQ